MEIINYAEHGVLVGSDGSIIIDDDYVVWRKNKETGKMENYSQKVKEARKTRANNYDDHPALDLYLYYSIPTNITVCLNKTVNSEIKSPTLDEYIKNTMPNEIYTSWHTEALIANAYCVKGVGIYSKFCLSNIFPGIWSRNSWYGKVTSVGNTISGK